MAAAGDGDARGGPHGLNPSIEEMLQKLNLTEEEGAAMDFIDEDEEDVLAPVEWALVGKILSPMPVHIDTVRSVMKPAWGNPAGLKIRAIGEKGNNMFVTEFGSARDLDRVMARTPWLFGKFAVLLQEYDEKLSALEIIFDRMELWVRILNLPLGWMNRTKRSKAASLIGQVMKMDVDADGKASGAFLRARVVIEVDKPIRRGVLLRMKRDEEPRWFHVQYEKPFICFSCGKMGHSELECPTSAKRDEYGKLSYDVQLRAPEERRKRIPSFASAAAESYGSGSSSAPRPPKQYSRSDGKGSLSGSHRSEGFVDELEDLEVQSPLKHNQKSDDMDSEGAGGASASRRLNLDDDTEGARKLARKRKSKVTTPVTQTPDLNIPVGGSSAIVPVGLVSSRVSQLGAEVDSGGSSMIETLKKQKCGLNQTERSAAPAESSPCQAP